MGQYKNGKWEPTFGDVQAGVSDWAPGEGHFRPEAEIVALQDKVSAFPQICREYERRIRELMLRIEELERDKQNLITFVDELQENNDE